MGSSVTPAESAGTRLLSVLANVRLPAFDWRFAYLVLMISGVFCVDAPKEAPVATALAVASAAVLFLLWLYQGRLRLDLSAVGLLLFFASLIISLPIAMMNGVSVRDWVLRGIAPFMFLSIYFFLPIRSQADARYVINVIVATCFLWGAKILLELTGAGNEVVLQRWTSIARDLLLPYNLVALAMLSLVPGIRPRVRSVGIALFAVMTLGAGYRIQLLIIALLSLVVLWRAVRRGAIVGPVIALAFISVAFVVFARTEAGQFFVERILALGSEVNSGRIREIQFAYQAFLQSPLLGNGLAYPVPLEVTFFGREEYLARISDGLSNYDHVAYMHNFVMYLLMNLGLLGFLSFGLFLAGTITRSGPYQRRLLTGDARLACMLALIAILGFTLAAATFTLFQFNVLIASLVALLSAAAPATPHRS